MQSWKRGIAAILLAALLLTALTGTALAVDHGYGYWQLTENQKYLYDLMAEYTADGAARIPVDESRGVTSDDAQMAMVIFTDDYPEYSWLGKNAGNQIYYFDIYLRDHAVVELEPRYNGLAAVMRPALQNAAQTALAGISSAQSQYDKALYLHDYLAQHVRYSYGMVGIDDVTAYGALVKGGAVCEGYARAYQYLLQKAGIQAWTVMGTATDNGRTEDHAWNLACLDGTWYYIDVTWDDTNIGITHDYFALTLSQMSADHTLGSPYSYMQPTNNTPVPVEPPPSPEELPPEESASPVQDTTPQEPTAAEPVPEELPEEPVEELPEKMEEEPETATSTAPEPSAATLTDTPEEPEQNNTDNTMLWCGIAVGAAVLIAVSAAMLHRRKKGETNE